MPADTPRSQIADKNIAARRHAVLRWILTTFDDFSVRTGLGAEEILLLMSLVMINQADVLRNDDPPWRSHSSLGALSQMTSIPKETVRRKLKKMTDSDLIHAETDQTYVINAENAVVKTLLAQIDRVRMT